MKKRILAIFLLIPILLNFNINYIYATNSDTTSENILEETENENEEEEEDVEDELGLYSVAAVLIDSNTGLVLYDKNANSRMYPASTTKILTAIIAIEECNLSDMVTVSESAVSAIPSGYSSAGLLVGEKISVNNLLLAFLIHSANDAGYVLAEYISGSIEEFADLMNEKAESIGCTNTHFTNPSGIHDEDHYTTAYDLALIQKYCMQNSTFREIVSMSSCTIPSTNKSDERTYSNTNSLLDSSSKYYISACIGGKTGYTSEAQNCLISSFSQDNMELISVVLGASSTETNESARYLDSIALYNYGYSNYSVKNLALKDEVIETITIANATKETQSLDIILENTISCLIKNGEEIENPIITLNSPISAPIEENEVLGTISYTINGIEYTENLLASHIVEEDMFLSILYKFILGFIAIMIIIFLIIKTKKNKKRKNNYYYCKHF